VVVLDGAVGLPVGGAGHPLVAHWVGAAAVEVLLRGGLGFCLGGIHGRYAATVGLGVGAKGCAGGNAERSCEGSGQVLKADVGHGCG
jgi:hypothetical protein